MKVKEILTEIKKVERLESKLNNKEALNELDLRDIGSILFEYSYMLGNKEIKDNED